MSSQNNSFSNDMMKKIFDYSIKEIQEQHVVRQNKILNDYETSIKNAENTQKQENEKLLQEQAKEDAEMDAKYTNEPIEFDKKKKDEKVALLNQILVKYTNMLKHQLDTLFDNSSNNKDDKLHIDYAALLKECQTNCYKLFVNECETFEQKIECIQQKMSVNSRIEMYTTLYSTLNELSKKYEESLIELLKKHRTDYNDLIKQCSNEREEFFKHYIDNHDACIVTDVSELITTQNAKFDTVKSMQCKECKGFIETSKEHIKKALVDFQMEFESHFITLQNELNKLKDDFGVLCSDMFDQCNNDLSRLMNEYYETIENNEKSLNAIKETKFKKERELFTVYQSDQEKMFDDKCTIQRRLLIKALDEAKIKLANKHKEEQEKSNNKFKGIKNLINAKKERELKSLENEFNQLKNDLMQKFNMK